MKIWKIASPYYGVEDPEWPKGHDYEPEWDHDVVQRPRGKMMQAFTQAANDIQNKHMTHFKDYFRRFRIEFVKGLGEYLGKYISGTYSEPVIVVDLVECANTQKQMKDEYPEMYHIAITTLMHELKHAMQDADGRFETEDSQDIEYEAEDFGMKFR
jgi:hypothetical protein